MMNRFMSTLALGISAILLSFASAASAATLVTDNSRLIGVENLSVGNLTYDVQFVDGSCVSVFDGCDDYSDFFFTDADLAIAAFSALETDVFQDIALGAFDTDPNITLGCDSQFGFCQVRAPVSLGRVGPIAITDFIPIVGFFNDINEPQDNVTSGTSPVTAASAEITYAVFSASQLPPVATVPLPASGLLYFGLGGLLVAIRHRKAPHKLA